jgi:hypothetical protein
LAPDDGAGCGVAITKQEGGEPMKKLKVRVLTSTELTHITKPGTLS